MKCIVYSAMIMPKRLNLSLGNNSKKIIVRPQTYKDKQGI